MKLVKSTDGDSCVLRAFALPEGGGEERTPLLFNKCFMDVSPHILHVRIRKVERTGYYLRYLHQIIL